MSLYSKILAFLNVLGVIGFIWLGCMDYAKRQQWAYAVHRYDLQIHGLPLDPQDADTEGNLKHEQLTEQTLKDLFPTNPVRTQVQEVERVQKLVEARVKGDSDARKQVYEAAAVLLPFATTNTQRENLLSLRAYLKDDASFNTLKGQLSKAYKEAQELLQIIAANPANSPRKARTVEEAFSEMLFLGGGDIKRPFERAFLASLKGDARRPFDEVLAEALESLRSEYVGRVDALFADALAKDAYPESPAPNKASPNRRRERLARLLLLTVELNPQDATPTNQAEPWSAPGYKRVLNVVGLKEAVPVLHEQAQLLGQFISEMQADSAREKTVSADLAAELARERSRFVTVHQTYLDFLQLRASQVAAQEALLTRTQDQVKKQQEVVERRKKDVADYEMRLADAQKITAEHLEQLRTMDAALFKERLENRGANETNLQLEQQIRRMERDRMPRPTSRRSN
jgi:hypothetical protein